MEQITLGRRQAVRAVKAAVPHPEGSETQWTLLLDCGHETRVRTEKGNRPTEAPCSACTPDAEPALAPRAVFSDCGSYRYALWREWATPVQSRCLFVMLNPSTADSEQDDPTIRRCIAFARAWGYDALDVANLFAWRATKPKDMKRAADPVGPGNDRWIAKLAERADVVVVAWGKNAEAVREARVLNLLAPDRGDIMCLGVNENRTPVHPLYQPGDTQRLLYHSRLRP